MLVKDVLLPGSNFTSVGGSFTYEVVGACCRLFDREQLPYPHCSLQWKGKAPSWRRVGRRFVPDMATLRSPSYVVKIVGSIGEPFEMTLYWTKLSPDQRVWWTGSRCRNTKQRLNQTDNSLRQTDPSKNVA